MASSDKKVDYKAPEIEARWQKAWRDNKTFSPNMADSKKPFYNLMMFPYPSAEGLHVGNMYAFTGADVYGRFMRMHGFDVFEPIGLDGFGIHSENYALKVGKHPREQAEISAKNFYRQLEATGNAYDWSKTLTTYDSEYYRWTQWLFVQMFKKGLAYRRSAQVNWCPSDKTVLADEQVIDGKCERDGAEVEKRELEQWFFKITEYADRLLAGLDRIDWPNKIKIAQRNWIGKSDGAVITFEIHSLAREIKVFTTRPDTLMGATFMVLSPEHPIVSELLASNKDTNKTDDDIKNDDYDIYKLDIAAGTLEELATYVAEAKKKTDEARQEDKEKTGVFSGLYCINPATNEKIPVWVADYVLMGYGTGAIMAVPAHDTRDFEFAKKFEIEIREVVRGNGSNVENEAHTGEGVLVNSGELDGIAVPREMEKVFEWMEKNGLGVRTTNYHLRDWLISRQRYWGPPIPMIYCSNCAKSNKGERADMPGWHTVSEAALPVELPDVSDWKPKGEGTSPLANHPEFYEVKCPECNGDARRETDVSDTFLDSAWYYLRYLSVGTNSASKAPYDIDVVKRWCPVSIYIGGAEHSVLHLLYVRFVALVLHDLKNQPQDLALPFEEPFPKFFAHGLIVKDGAKMSKSRGNVVVPDSYIAKFGSDTLRMYLMFLGQFSDGGDFRDSGIEGMNRFVRRVWNFATQVSLGGEEEDVKREIHKTVKKVSDDMEKLSYNTAIARLMEFYNFAKDKKQVSKETILSYLKLIAPFAPHMAEELYQNLELGDGSIHFTEWPSYNDEYLVEEKLMIAIQVNGKRRGEIEIDAADQLDQTKVEQLAKSKVSHYVENGIRKAVYVPGKIINFVV